MKGYLLARIGKGQVASLVRKIGQREGLRSSLYKWGDRGGAERATWSQASQLSMATLRLLLLLASWALLGTLQLQADARPAPYVVKLCGREFIRAVIFTCGGSRWRRADGLAHDSLGEYVCGLGGGSPWNRWAKQRRGV